MTKINIDHESYKDTAHRLRELGSRIPHLHGLGTAAPEAWMFGSKGENTAELERLIVSVIRDIGSWRSHFQPEDPAHVTERVKATSAYRHTIAFLREDLESLLDFLKRSVPAFSLRYQAHMGWDITLPSIVGYFAAMLYNNNNVAFEGSPATTVLEMLVGDDLCQMLGYKIPPQEDIKRGEMRPWGHITCGGTVANIEALWSARNLKFFPLAVRACMDEKRGGLENAKGLAVAYRDSEKARLVDLDTWSLLNLAPDEILKLPPVLAKFVEDGKTLSEVLQPYSVQALGMAAASLRYLGRDINAPVFFVPGSKHYSFNKAAGLLGIGLNNMKNIPTDSFARQRVDILEEQLEKCLQDRTPVISTVVVLGSTEESAIDPLKNILALRAKMRRRGLDFTVHVDAAWGGYCASMIRDDFKMRPIQEGDEEICIESWGGDSLPSNPVTSDFHDVPEVPVLSLSSYVAEQFEALDGADSITVDPHKQGYIPYPAGALCYRNSSMRDLVTFDAPYLYLGNIEPQVGVFGIEGSKPGAAAASVFLSHRLIRPTRSGYGRMLGMTLYNCKMFYVHLNCMDEGKDFICVPLAKPPNGSSDADFKASLAGSLSGLRSTEIARDQELLALLAESGPDLNIIAYAFNFRLPSGELNTDLNLVNEFNDYIYDQVKIQPSGPARSYDLIVSRTEFTRETYGDEFMDDYFSRIGITGGGDAIRVLRTCVMDPWIMDTAEGPFVARLVGIIESAVEQAVSRIRNNHSD